ncbi:MAG: hypothetical protein JXR73_06805 [Candidatus Omnitrophica bacterium]|nr:hypothetical protein [Candidatus Omnitrophota bacterium]
MILLCGCLGCASSQRFDHENTLSSDIASNRPATPSKVLQKQSHPFEGRLPLGIGARIDLFISDAASGVSEIYESYLKPLRKGKIFTRRPYELDYSILPKKGEAFNHKASPLDSVSIRSDYKVQIGISRKFRHLTDFLKADFWLAHDEYSTAPAALEAAISPLQQFQLNDSAEKEEKIDLSLPVALDLEQFLSERWKYSSDFSINPDQSSQ